MNLYRLYPNSYDYEIIPIKEIKYEHIKELDCIKECYYDDKYNMFYRDEYIYIRKRLKTSDIINEPLIFKKEELLKHFQDRRRLYYDNILNEYKTISILDDKILSLTNEE